MNDRLLQVDNWYYIVTQRMRVHLKINGNNWEMEGVPSDEPLQGDEVLTVQYQWLKILNQYDLYKIDFIDAIMAVPEFLFGWLLSLILQRKSWKHEGRFDETIR